MRSYREGFFSSHDGLQLYRRTWCPASEEAPRGVIALVHGFGDHSGRFRFLVEALCSWGYRVEAFDCRGHGQSEGERGHVDDFDHYLLDLDGFLSAYAPPQQAPTYLLGHSQGGHICLRYGIQHDSRGLAGVIVSSPFLGLSYRPPLAQLVAAHLSSKVFPTFSQGVGLEIDHLTHEPEVRAETRRDPLYGRVASARWLTATMEAISDTMRRSYLFRYPLLMQQSGDERIVDKEAGARFFEQCSSQQRRRFEYADSYHEIYNETPERREATFRDLHAWLFRREPAHSS